MPTSQMMISIRRMRRSAIANATKTYGAASSRMNSAMSPAVSAGNAPSGAVTADRQADQRPGPEFGEVDAVAREAVQHPAVEDRDGDEDAGEFPSGLAATRAIRTVAIAIAPRTARPQLSLGNRDIKNASVGGRQLKTDLMPYGCLRSSPAATG